MMHKLEDKKIKVKKFCQENDFPLWLVNTKTPDEIADIVEPWVMERYEFEFYNKYHQGHASCQESQDLL